MTPGPSPLPPNVARAMVTTSGIDRRLSGVGQRIGTFLSHPNVNVNVSHPAPMLALALIFLAVCGSIPAGVWCFKRRRHLRSHLRGVASLKVWKERWKWHRHIAPTEIHGRPAPKTIGGWPTRSGVTLV
ncbi:MAG TPA: hypothetical protein VNA32_02755, partial [Actinomycetota bacterium]|nr:hypothetical protein [Actinomycetota bacterium]